MAAHAGLGARARPAGLDVTRGEDTLRRVVAALRKHAPDLVGAPLTPLGGGLDNEAVLSGRLVLRAVRDGDVVREARLLARLGPLLPIPVPVPRFADPEAGVLAYPLLEGRPLLGRTPPPEAAELLGRFLRELHAVEPSSVADAAPLEETAPAEWLEDLPGPAALLEALRSDIPPPTQLRVLAHNDLGAEHILEHGGRLTGVIDWSDAALTDPCVDFARPHRDFGPEFLRRTLEVYGGPPGGEQGMRRIVFYARCAALEDLAYGHRTGSHKYTSSARRSLRWLFPDTSGA